MFDLNKITHINNIKGYSEEDIIKMVLVCGKCLKIKVVKSFTEVFVYYKCKCGRMLVFCYDSYNVLRIRTISTEKDNCCHNDIGIPAKIFYDINCNISCIRYMYKGKLHNINKPSNISYTHNLYFIVYNKILKIQGRFVYCYLYSINGNYHNRKGPAYIRLFNENNKPYFQYYIHGKVMSKDMLFSNYTKRLIND